VPIAPIQHAELAKLPVRPLLGQAFADLDVGASAAWVDARPDGAPFGYVVTPNADHLVRLSRNPALLPLYAGAMLRLLDSRVVTTGSDLTARLLARHLRPGERVTIIGLRDAHLAPLIERTGIASPAHYDPPMGFDRDPAEMARAVRFVLDHPARLVFLAVGSPRQEQLAAALATDGRVTGTGLCIGASLEFLAGAIPRAPHFMQVAGIEWLHRLLVDPRRLARRYLWDNPVIFRLLLQERRRGG
jgi:N-acetylglucosaminyldiphosphoundecaprenol N-acetyl-beta-D-mannosaminyltransferase